MEHIGVFYDLIPHKKINGSLFYAFEYFVFLNKFKKTVFYISNIRDEYIGELKEVFKNRYNFNNHLLDRIIAIKTIKQYTLINKNIKKALFVDVRSYENIHAFLNCPLVIYSNEAHEITTKKPHKVFGYYDYQNFQIKEKLKFNFEIYKPISNKKTNTALVTRVLGAENVIHKIDIKENNIIYKPKEHAIESVFEKFDTLYYYHSFLDTNNRLIVESLYYNKNVEIIYTGLKKDSVYYRYNDIMNNGVDGYRLTKDDLIIQEMLSENS